MSWDAWWVFTAVNVDEDEQDVFLGKTSASFWCLQTRSENEDVNRSNQRGCWRTPIRLLFWLFPSVSYSLWKECTNGLDDDVTPVIGSFCTHPSGLQKCHYLTTLKEAIQIKGRQAGRKTGGEINERGSSSTYRKGEMATEWRKAGNMPWCKQNHIC